MLCTCIYFVDIRSFDGDKIRKPPHDPGMDPDDDQHMANVEDHDQEAGAERHGSVGVPIPPFSRHGRLDTRHRMELGDQLSALIF